VKAYEAIVKGENIQEPSIPESFKVLLKEMQSLGLDVKVEGESGPQLAQRQEDDDLLRAAEELGIDLSGGLGANRRDGAAEVPGPETEGAAAPLPAGEAEVPEEGEAEAGVAAGEAEGQES
jgi:DNA-directed RNA polymerase subunit beta